MEVENVEGTSPTDKNSSGNKNKKVIILAVVFAVIVVGLAITIAVVMVNRGKNDADIFGDVGESTEENADGEAVTDEEVVDKFDEITGEIALKVVEALETAGDDGEGLSIEEILNLYQEKINEAKNIKLKAMLQSEYYMTKMSQDPGVDIKDEILNGMVGIDKILKTASSALRVSNVAAYYGDEALADQYYRLAMERMPEENTDDTGGEDTEDNTNYDDEETVG